MTAVLAIAFLAAVLLIHLVLHETAHALALHRMGGEIRAAGLGFPFPPTLRLKPTERRPFELTLSPWLLGAYVEPTRESERAMGEWSYLDRAWFSAAGVIVNFVTGLVLAAVVFAWTERWVLAGAVVVVAAVMWLARRLVAGFVVPLIGVVGLVAVAVGLARALGERQAGGIVGVFTSQPEFSVSGMVGIAAAIAIALGLVNCIPLWPLDGGRVLNAAIEPRLSRKAVERVQVVAFAGVLLIVAGSALSDVLWAVS